MKSALKNSILAAFKNAVQVKKIENLPFDFYVKKFSIAEMNAIEKINNEERSTEKMIAFILCNESGEKIFSFDDLDFISEFADIDFVKKCQKEFLEFNGINNSNEKK